MSDAAVKYEIDEAREQAYSTPIDEIDVSRAELFKTDTMWPYFERLRKEAPVHYCPSNEEFGPYWSVTKYNDIMAVDTNHQVFSSEEGITLRDQDEDFKLPMFIAMDPPKQMRSTQSTGCCVSISSRRRPARSRIVLSSLARFAGATMGLTTLR